MYKASEFPKIVSVSPLQPPPPPSQLAPIPPNYCSPPQQRLQDEDEPCRCARMARNLSHGHRYPASPTQL